MFNSLLKNIDLSNEAISFQGASPFAKDMTKLFQSVMTYRDSLRGKLSGKQLQSKVFEYHTKHVPKNFTKIVKKHTGINVRNIETSAEASLGFACLMSFGKEIESGNAMVVEAIRRYSGKEKDEWDPSVPAPDEDIETALENVSSVVDTVKGKLDKAEFKGIKQIEDLWCDVFFCYISAYLAKDIIHESCPEFTAAEVAAIMLHEIGHMLSAVEHAGDLIRAHDTLSEYVSIKNVTPDNVDDVTKASLKGLSKLEGMTKKDFDYIESLDSGSSNVDEIKKKSGIFGKTLAVLLEIIGSVAILALSFVGMVILRPLLLVFGGGYELSHLLTQYKTKRSDFMANFGDNCLCERYADEYVARHGFAPHIVSALAKIMPIATALFSVAKTEGGRESTIVYRIAQFRLYVMMLMFGQGEDTDGQYENEANRAKSLARDVLKVFKQTNMPPELLDYYIKNYEDTVKALEATKPKGLANKLLQANILITRAANPSTLLKLLLVGKADSNYKKLMDAVQNISANKLHYYRAKLDQLYRNM